MRIIKKVTEQIEDELRDAERYALCALKYKEEYPELASVYNCLSNEEMHHVDLLHKETVRLIERHRSSHGEPPANMMAVYDYLHERQIDRAREIRELQEQYRK